MRREPIVYGALLVVALALAFRAWTRDDRVDAAAGGVQVWRGKAEDIVGLEFSRPGKRVELRRRGPAGASYLWGTEDTTDFRMAAGASQRVLSALAAPRALRDLGVPDPPALRGYALDTARSRLVVRFRGGNRELLLGGQVPGFSGDRYVLERHSGHVYVLPASSLPDLNDARVVLVERALHAFPAERVASVTVRAAGGTLSVRRVPGAGQGQASTSAGWARVGGAQQPDPRLAGFMEKLDRLAAAGYAAREDPRSMTLVLRAEYADQRGRLIGFLELFRRAGPGGGSQHFARSELTGVLVHLFPGTGDSLEADAAQLLMTGGRSLPRP